MLSAFVCTAASRQMSLKATPVPDPVFMKLKDLMSSRSRLVAQLHSTKNYIKALQCTIEAMIEQILHENKAVYTNYQLIKTVPGTGHLTAICIICCTNNFAAKPSGKQLGSYAGVVPFTNSSGTSIKGKNKVHKMANKELKKMLHRCALTAIKYNSEFKQYFDRKKAEGKNGMLVSNAIRNKLVRRVVAVVNKQQPCVDNIITAA